VGTGIAILNIVPPGPLRIGSEVHVIGTNFGFTTGASRVFLVTNTASVPINAFKLGSNDQELIFNVPSIPGVLAAGTSAQLSVSNGVASVTRNVVLLPAQSTVAGSVDVVWMGATPNPIVAGPGPADFEYSIRALTNIDATYLITPLVRVSANQAAWQAALQVLDAAKAPLPGGSLTLLPGEQKTIFVRLASVPANPLNAQFSIGAQAGSGGVLGNSGLQGYQVGQATPQPDTTFTLTLDSVQFDPPGSGTFVNQVGSPLGVSLTPNAAAVVKLKADMTVAGSYALLATIPLGLVDWSAQVWAQTTVNPMTILATDLTTNGHAIRNPDFLIQTAANPTANSTVTLSVTRQGATTSRNIQLDIARL
jgi:hypothetical protein